MAEKDALLEVVELSMLFDFYGELLGEHKKQIFEDYFLNDLSLSEISEAAGISRQGVHDIIKRCTRMLYEYEEKLSLVKKFSSAKQKINNIKKLTDDINRCITNDIVNDTTNDIVNDINCNTAYDTKADLMVNTTITEINNLLQQLSQTASELINEF